MTNGVAVRTPPDEARRIVDELSQQMQGMPVGLQQLPSIFFRELCAAGDIEQTAVEIERTIVAASAVDGMKEYLLSVVRACAYSAFGMRLSGDHAWRAVMDALRHSGVALALFVSVAEAVEAKKALARAAKGAQTAENDAIRLHVLNAAAGSSLNTPSGAAANIAGKLDSKPGGLAEALKAFGANLKADQASVARAFAGYIRKDMDRLVPFRPGENPSQPENRERFGRWKKLYGSPANG